MPLVNFLKKTGIDYRNIALFVSIVAAIMITCGRVWWIAGTILLLLALITRFGIFFSNDLNKSKKRDDEERAIADITKRIWGIKEDDRPNRGIRTMWPQEKEDVHFARSIRTPLLYDLYAREIERMWSKRGMTEEELSFLSLVASGIPIDSIAQLLSADIKAIKEKWERIKEKLETG